MDSAPLNVQLNGSEVELAPRARRPVQSGRVVEHGQGGDLRTPEAVHDVARCDLRPLVEKGQQVDDRDLARRPRRTCQPRTAGQQPAEVRPPRLSVRLCRELFLRFRLGTVILRYLSTNGGE